MYCKQTIYYIVIPVVGMIFLKIFYGEEVIQRGFCTPGMLVAAKALLARNPVPSADEIKDALRVHLCRCTDYDSIVEAIQYAASMQTAVTK